MQASGCAGTEQLVWKHCSVITILLSFPTFPFLLCAAGMRGNDFLPVLDGTGGGGWGSVCACYAHGVSSPAAMCAPNFGQKALQAVTSVPGRWDRWVCLGNNSPPPQLPAHLHRGWLHAPLPYVRIRRLHHAPEHHHGRQSVPANRSLCAGSPPLCIPLIAPFCTRGT